MYKSCKVDLEASVFITLYTTKVLHSASYMTDVVIEVLLAKWE